MANLHSRLRYQLEYQTSASDGSFKRWTEAWAKRESASPPRHPPASSALHDALDAVRFSTSLVNPSVLRSLGTRSATPTTPSDPSARWKRVSHSLVGPTHRASTPLQPIDTTNLPADLFARHANTVH